MIFVCYCKHGIKGQPCIVRNVRLCVRDGTESVIIAIRKVVPQKSGARTIDCAMDYCVIV